MFHLTAHAPARSHCACLLSPHLLTNKPGAFKIIVFCCLREFMCPTGRVPILNVIHKSLYGGDVPVAILCLAYRALPKENLTATWLLQLRVGVVGKTWIDKVDISIRVSHYLASRHCTAFKSSQVA